MTPLTAANLKRATSVGSSYASPAASRGRFVYDAYNYKPPSKQSHRTLHAQASSPTMGRDFDQSQWRGFSETELPERPYTALDMAEVPDMATVESPMNESEPTWPNPLRGSRSYDSLGGGAMRREPLYSNGSPNSNLEPLAEDDGQYYHASSHSNTSYDGQEDGLGIHRSPSRTEDLRDQMNSLKGKISSLKERAREDSLRRQSVQNLRATSPFNNATVNAPEFFYTSSPSYGTPALDTNAGLGRSSKENSPATPQSAQKLWEPKQLLTGSRNAFAEQAQKTQQGNGSDAISQQPSPVQKQQSSAVEPSQQRPSLHKKTPSGTAILQASKHRYSHHQYYRVQEMPGSYLDDTTPNEPSSASESRELGSPRHAAREEDHTESGASVYEDADSEPRPPVVAHEDREDAFDYEQFFLHSAMASYGIEERPKSMSSEASISSVETARGPAAALHQAGDDECDADGENYPPATPETPDKLREIERSLHKRTLSEDSVSTLATFATADEGRDGPPDSKRSSVLDWPIPRADNDSRPNSRPSTAIPVKRPTPITSSDSSSERADSGIGLPKRSNSSHDTRRPSTFAGSPVPTSSAMSPPMSPRSVVDPATKVVNALLEPGSGTPLGLKDKALLFGLVENLRKVCHRLQDGGGSESDQVLLRRRLDAANRALARS